MRRRAGWAVRAASAAFVGVLAVASCREPTSLSIEVRTNVPWRAGIRTSFTVDRPGRAESTPPATISTSSWGSDGLVGTLTAVPESSSDASVSVKIVMGITRDPTQCLAANYVGCIVARRQLRYRPHERLVLPISLFEKCTGQSCDPSSTCNYLGQCVPAAVDCLDNTCSSPADPPLASDGGLPGEASTDDRVIAGDGAPADGPISGDAIASDAPHDVTVVDGPPFVDGGTPGFIDCPGTTDGRCGPSQQCCYRTSDHTGVCADLGGPCPSQYGIFIRCDDNNDCGDDTCCTDPSGTVCFVGPCKFGRTLVCHASGYCGGAGCTGLIGDYFRYCQ